MTQLLSTLLPVLAWAAIPVTLIAVIDDWFLRPRRRLAQGSTTPPDPALMRGFYLLLPVVLIAVVLELLGFKHEADLGGCWSYVKGYAEKENITVVDACMKTLTRTCKAVALILDTAEAIRQEIENSAATPEAAAPS